MYHVRAKTIRNLCIEFLIGMARYYYVWCITGTVLLLSEENCTNNALTDVDITRVDPEDDEEGFRCCFDDTMQVCNDPLVQCDEATATFQEAELICNFRGGHLCTEEETRLDCCLSHRCAADTDFTDRRMWLASPKAGR